MLLRIFNQRRHWLRATGQSLVRWFFRILTMLCYRVRVHGLENYPKTERILVCANHQSFLDPIIVGVVCPRPVNYLARKTLFDFLPLAAFLRFNDTIPLDRESSGLAGVKETLRRLKKDEAVVMFPEGTRSKDGELLPLMPGFYLLAKRTKATLMPLGIDGCFTAYPPGAWLPRPGKIDAVMGKPIPFEEYAELSEQETTELLEARLKTCFEEARERRTNDTKAAQNAIQG